MIKPLPLLVALIIALLALGLMTMNGSLIALALPLIVYLGVAIHQRVEDVDLSIERSVEPERAPDGARVTVRTRIVNQGREIEEAQLLDLLPDGFQAVEGKTMVTACLSPGEELQLEYTTAVRRGQYKALATQVTALEGFGVFECTAVQPAPLGLVAYPRHPRLQKIKIHPPQTRGFAGPITARQGGSGVDFFTVRPYHPGDPRRMINWKVAARSRQQLFTNVFEQERVADVGIILDARLRADLHTAQDTLFEHSVFAAATLADGFLSDGNRVSLVVYGATVERVFPGYGRRQKDRILSAIAKAVPGHNFALESLAYLPTRFFPAGSQIVLISPLFNEDITILHLIRARGYALLLVSPDPISFALKDKIEPENWGYRLAQAERHLLLQRALRAGAQVVNWQVDSPLISAVRNTLALQRVNLRGRGLP